MKVKIVKGSGWSEGMEGEVFEVRKDNEYRDDWVYELVEDTDNPDRFTIRFIQPDNCELVQDVRGDEMKDTNEVREALARYSHDSAWSGWMKYMFKQGYYKVLEVGMGKNRRIESCWVMPLHLVERWQRQMDTLYDDLPENEKTSDRAEADKMLAILDPDQLRARVAALERVTEAAGEYIQASPCYPDITSKQWEKWLAYQAALAALDAGARETEGDVTR